MIASIRALSTPVIIGLLIALFYLFFTTRGAQTVQHEIVLVEKQVPAEPLQSTINITDTVSYADAVSKAQPAVVNIYTTKLITERRHPLYDDPRFRRFFWLKPGTAPSTYVIEPGLGGYHQPIGLCAYQQPRDCRCR